ncbi:MAG TPA: Ig-like domain-containing protein [Bryobacteraceae bacterium]
MAHLSDGTTQDVTAGTQWTVSNGALGTLVNGVLTAKAQGTLMVQAAYVEAAPAGSSPASAVASPQNLNASAQVTITAASGSGAINVPTITWNPPAAITYGTALSTTQLSATASVPGTFAYTPAAGTVLKAGKQTISAAFIPTNTKTYSAATASVQLTVNQAAPAITWATPAPIASGTALGAAQLNATANVPGSFMYNPALGAVLAAGTQQLTAVFSPTDNTDYSSATAHASVVVNSTSGGPNPTPVPPAPGPAPPGPTPAGGCQLASGASTSAIQTAINSAANNSCAAPSTSTVVFTAGNYTISSQLSIPCPKTAMVITGPTPAGVGTTWPITPTAILTSTLTNQWAFSGNGCGVGTTFQYLQFNGGNPSGGGGGFLYVPAGMNNLTVTYNWLYGNSAIASTTQFPDTTVWLDGEVTSTRTSGVTIKWNRFGNAATNDCAGLMNLYGGGNFCSSSGYGTGSSSCLYQGAQDITHGGGSCGGVGVHVNTDNLNISNNSFQHLEQPLKLYEAPGTAQWSSTNTNIQYNDLAGTHRIGLEAQAGVNLTVDSNDFHDPIKPNAGQWALSLPQNATNNKNNILIANTPVSNDQNGQPGFYAGCGIEFWGNGVAANNLIQGLFCAGVDWGFGSSPWSIVNNAIQLTSSTSQIGNEENQSNTPSLAGNVTSQSVAAMTSAAPAISPSGGSQKFPLTITVTDQGNTSGAGPQGNTGIWYTTDGSTPVPGTGTTKYLASGGTFTLSAAATVKAVGMWGALNQPTSYPAGYGFVPSAVVTASYATGSIARPAATARSSSSDGQAATTTAAANSQAQGEVATPVLESVAIVPSQPAVALGSTTQLKAIATFDDGSTKDVTTDFAWTSSDPRTLGASSSGLLTGLATGKAMIAGSYQSHQASVAASSALGAVQWSGPIVITHGGTYSGNWQSNDPQIPAVTVSTTEPVIVENSHIRSASGLIKAETSGSDLIVRNNVAIATNPAVKGQPNGIFLQATSPARLDVENNYIENASSGVLVHGYSGNRDGRQTIVIRANRARNLSGLLSDGNDGYLPGGGSNHSVSRFIELDNVQAVPGIDVGWNEVVNYPGRSLVSDNIDVNRSSGTPNQPLEIHDTYIQGAYPYKAAQDAYAGGGIKTEGGSNDSSQDTAAFSSIHDNQVVGTVSYGIAFTAGHDNIASNNRVISSGLLADGTRIAAQQVGMADGDVKGTGVANGSMYNNTMHDNVIGWACWTSSCAKQGYRKDQYFPVSPGDYSNNSLIPAQPITLNMEDNEYQVWLNKTASAGIMVGPTL